MSWAHCCWNRRTSYLRGSSFSSLLEARFGVVAFTPPKRSGEQALPGQLRTFGGLGIVIRPAARGHTVPVRVTAEIGRSSGVTTADDVVDHDPAAKPTGLR